jgi:transcription-repair coupling factor (superfamily II helicase)
MLASVKTEVKAIRAAFKACANGKQTSSCFSPNHYFGDAFRTLQNVASQLPVNVEHNQFQNIKRN